MVEPPRRIVYTFGWETDRALPGGVEAVAPGSTTVEVELEADGEETVVHVRHFGFTTEAFTQSHEVGWRYSIERLTAFAAGGDPGPFRPDYLAAAVSDSPKARPTHPG